MTNTLFGRRLNFKLAVPLLVLLVLLGVGTHFLHAYQVKRNARHLRHLADEALADGRLQKARGHLAHYLELAPDDASAMADLALLLDRLATTPRGRETAFVALERVLRHDPGRADVRRRAAEIAIVDLGRYKAGREYVEQLLADNPYDPELYDLLGRCWEVAVDAQEEAGFPKSFPQLVPIQKVLPGAAGMAEVAYRKAIALDHRRVATYERLARLFQRQPDGAKQAAKLMDEMVKKNPESMEAILAEGRYRWRAGQLQQARSRVESALKDLPNADKAEALAFAGQLALEDRQLDQAQQHFQKGRQKFADDPRFLLGLANVELRRTSPDRARANQYVQDAVELAKKVSDPAQQAGVLWTAANLFLDAEDAEQAGAIIERLHQQREPGEGMPAGVAYLRARLELLKGHPGEAVQILQNRKQDLARVPGLAERSEQLLAMCHRRLGNVEEELKAFKRAADLEPTSPALKLTLASAYLQAGNLDEALALYRQLDSEAYKRLAPPDAPPLKVVILRILLVRVLQQKGNLADLEIILKDTPEDVRNTAEFRLFKAELEFARDPKGKGPEKAKKELEDACADYPKNVSLWLGRAALAASGKPEVQAGPALAVLDEAQQQLGDKVELRLARAGYYLAGRPPAEALAALKKLEEGADRLSADDQKRLRLGLADAYARLDARADAEPLLELLAKQDSQDLASRTRLLDLAIQAGDQKALTAMASELRKIEGKGGTLSLYAEAVGYLLAAAAGDKSGLVTARKLLGKIREQRPGWARLTVLEAQLEELEGHPDAAIAKYLAAIDQGERHPPTIRQAVRLLIGRRRNAEAQAILDRLRQQGPLSGDLSRLAAEASLFSSDPKDVEQHLQVVDEKSKDFRDHLLRGHLHWTAARQADLNKDIKGAEKLKLEALSAFSEAVKLKGDEPATWTTLVIFLYETDRADEARAKLEEARKALKDKAPLALGPCYEAMKQLKDAEAEYKARSGDLPGQRELAAFYLRTGQLGEAEERLRVLISLGGLGQDDSQAWARRHLALVLAVGGRYEQTSEALKLLDANLRERPDSAEDSRVRALVLAVQPGGRAQSIKTLEESFGRVRPTPDEEFLLARLYDLERDRDKAREHLRRALDVPGGAGNPEHLAYMVSFLIRWARAAERGSLAERSLAAEAAGWLERLKKIDGPQALRPLELQVRLFHEQQDPGLAAALGELNKKINDEFDKKKDADLLRGAGLLMEHLGKSKEAEERYRQFVAETKRPDGPLVLVAFLANQGRLGEALDLFDRTRQQVRIGLAASIGAAILRTGKARPEDFKRVEGWLKPEADKAPGDLELQVALADLRDAQGRYDEAMTIYRSIIEKHGSLGNDAENNSYVLALNNLAWLLTVKDKGRQEALEHILKAISLAGPLGSLQDTLGVVYLHLGDYKQAISNLEKALADSPSASRWYHLAQAHHAAKERAAAERALRKAEEMLALQKKELKDLLHPLELEQYDRLVAELKQPGGGPK